MFGDLASFVGLLRSAASDFRARKSAVELEEAVLAMLEVYFYLKDVVDEGEALVLDAGPEPIKRLGALPDDEAEITLVRWDFALKRQAFRLREISKLVFGQEFLEVVSPDLRDQLNKVVGSKFHRATSLRGIGAALFFRAIFPVEKTKEDRAGYIALMAGERGDILRMDKIKQEIAALRIGMQSYQEAIARLLSREEIIKLSGQARKNTTFDVQ